MAKQSKSGPDIGGLYGLPLDEFTPTRDALAAELRKAGDREGAERVKALRKPNVAAWALNQVQRTNPAQVDELIEAGERLREGQDQLLAGGDRQPLDEAVADQRRLVADLARHAERELVAAGRPVSASVQEKLRATLNAAASDPEAQERLAAGQLVRDHQASGMGPLAPEPAASAGAPSKKPAPKATAATKKKVSQLEEKLERARERESELDDERKDARRRLGDARREATRAAAELERAEAAEVEARRNVEDAADAVRQLERELRQLK
jgi:hypothetical protein